MSVPGPRSSPRSWDSIEIPTRLAGIFTVPPRSGLGAVDVDCKNVGREIERSKPAGKDKGKVKDKGVKGASGTIQITADVRYWEDGEQTLVSLIDAVHPRGAESGGPFEAKHAALELHKIAAIKVVDIDGPTWEGHLCRCTLQWEEVDPATQKETGKGTVKTDKDAVQWEHARPAVPIGPPAPPLVPVENPDGTTTAIRADRVRGFDNPAEAPPLVPEGFVP